MWAWLEQDGDAYVFQAKGPEQSSKYRTVPHPYVEIDGKWYCWDTFRLRLTPGTGGDAAVETVGSGPQSGAFVATRGTATLAD